MTGMPSNMPTTPSSAKPIKILPKDNKPAFIDAFAQFLQNKPIATAKQSSPPSPELPIQEKLKAEPIQKKPSDTSINVIVQVESQKSEMPPKAASKPPQTTKQLQQQLKLSSQRVRAEKIQQYIPAQAPNYTIQESTVTENGQQQKVSYTLLENTRKSTSIPHQQRTKSNGHGAAAY